MVTAGGEKTETQAEFARRKKVSRKTVTQWKAKGLLSMTPDGRVKIEESEWLLAERPANYRGGVTKGNAEPSKAARTSPLKDETPEQAAERIVLKEGAAPYDHAEAVRIKENFLAMLRQLEYDMKSGAVVPVEEVAKQVAAEYAIIRSRLISIPARSAARLVVLKTPEEIKSFLDIQIEAALKELTLDGTGGGREEPPDDQSLPSRGGKARRNPEADKGRSA